MYGKIQQRKQTPTKISSAHTSTGTAHNTARKIVGLKRYTLGISALPPFVQQRSDGMGGQPGPPPPKHKIINVEKSRPTGTASYAAIAASSPPNKPGTSAGSTTGITTGITSGTTCGITSGLMSMGMPPGTSVGA